MSALDGGGSPAFPWCGDLNECPTINLGMSLRDYFAAKAIDRALSITESTDGNYDFDGAAMCAYAIADAMLKARNA